MGGGEWRAQKSHTSPHLTSHFPPHPHPRPHQYAFAATAATIVSGSVAERCKLEAYFIYTFFITVFLYPVVVHWGWADGGELRGQGREESAAREEDLHFPSPTSPSHPFPPPPPSPTPTPPHPLPPGWLSPFNSDGSTVLNSANGMIDFAGSGIVHMVGGFAGLAGAVALGPRIARFNEKTGKPMEMKAYNAPLQVLGTLFLWVGWC